MSEPRIAAKAPLAVNVEAGKTYWWWLPQGFDDHAGEVPGRRVEAIVVLRLQALVAPAPVRRHPQQAVRTAAASAADRPGR